MQQMDQHLQPRSAVQGGSAAMLPAARIHCDCGWIRVGEQVYQSASEALGAYLQQFDARQVPAGSLPVSAATSVGSVIQRSAHPACSQVQHLNGRSVLFNAPLLNSHGSSNVNSESLVQALAVSFSSSPSPGSNARTTVSNARTTVSSAVQALGTRSIPSVTTAPLLTANSYSNSKISTQTLLPSGAVGYRAGPRSAVETLLCSQPSQNSPDVEVVDVLRQIRLKQVAQEAETRKLNISKSHLQQEVEAALSRSAQLLETIKGDTLVTPQCTSDVGSMSTDVLLSINPRQPGEALSAVTSRQGRSQHRYSYYTPSHQLRSSSLSRMPTSINVHSLRESGRRRSLESLSPAILSGAPGRRILHDSSSSGRVSCVSEPSSILRNSQDHSLPQVSETLGKEPNKKQYAAPQKGGHPSWISDLIPSIITAAGDAGDSDFSEKKIQGGRPIPSWVNGLAPSEFSYSTTGTQELQDTAEPQELLGTKSVVEDLSSKPDESSVIDLSYAAPGLNYSDLVSSPGTKKHRVSFNTHRLPPPSKKLTLDVHSRFGHSLSLGNQTNKSLSLSMDSASRVSNSLQGNSTAGIQSIDRYLSHLDLDTNTVNNNAGKAKIRPPGVGLSSSMDKVHFQNLPSTTSFVVTGASPIARTSNLTNGMFVDDPASTPPPETRSEGGGDSVEAGPVLDDLDGDRPWEMGLSSFKPPVYVGNLDSDKYNTSPAQSETPTLSGGPQPGSMEALKKMLFRLQTEETSSSDSIFKLSSPSQAEVDGATLIPALKDYNFEEEPGGQSLERALVHLGRLKTLVQSASVPTHQERETDLPSEYSQEPSYHLRTT